MPFPPSYPGLHSSLENSPSTHDCFLSLEATPKEMKHFTFWSFKSVNIFPLALFLWNQNFYLKEYSPRTHAAVFAQLSRWTSSPGPPYGGEGPTHGPGTTSLTDSTLKVKALHACGRVAMDRPSGKAMQTAHHSACPHFLALWLRKPRLEAQSDTAGSFTPRAGSPPPSFLPSFPSVPSSLLSFLHFYTISRCWLTCCM